MILLKLILAHILGDFFLQPEKWAKSKEKKKLRSGPFYLHILVHLLLVFILLWDISLWKLALSVVASHFIIDTLKLYLQNKKNKRWLFFLDQLLHLLAIIALFIFFTDQDFSFETYLNFNNALMLVCLLFLTRPVSFFMRTIFSKWNLETITPKNDSLKDAGQYIGILERLLVFIFIVTQQWSAIGFLITAKSVFRFGDLMEAKQRKLTEYYLIGTLISFGIAIVVGLIYLKFRV